jgi:hypothetical protein
MAKTFFWMKFFFWVWFLASIGQAVMIQSPEYLAETGNFALLTAFCWFFIADFGPIAIAKLESKVDYDYLKGRLDKLEKKETCKP